MFLPCIQLPPAFVLLICPVIVPPASGKSKLAWPVKVAFIVAGNFNVAFALPLTLTAEPVFVPSLSAIEIFLAVPQLAVVILAEPLKLVPLMVLLVCKVVAVEALPVKLALIVAGNFNVAFALPLTLTAEPVLVPSLSAI